MRLVARGFEKSLESLAQQSVQKGYSNVDMVTHLEAIVNALIAEGLLPADCYIGRQKFLMLSGLERSAITVPVEFLESRREDILNWIEDNWDLNAESVFNALRNGSVIATSLGLVPCSNPVVKQLCDHMQSLPSGKARMKALRNRQDTLKQLSAG